MILVTSELKDVTGSERSYDSYVRLDGSRAEIICEIKALINSFLDDSELENIYLSISTEIARAHIEELEGDSERSEE